MSSLHLSAQCGAPSKTIYILKLLKVFCDCFFFFFFFFVCLFVCFFVLNFKVNYAQINPSQWIQVYYRVVKALLL